MNFIIDDTLGYRINRCSILMKASLTRRFKAAGHDLTPEEWVILTRLWPKDGLSQNELADTTLKDKTTITRFLVQMEKKQLVFRKTSTQDARVKHVYLTPSAQALKDQLIPLVQGFLRDCAIEIEPVQFAITLSTLSAIEQNLLRAESEFLDLTKGFEA